MAATDTWHAADYAPNSGLQAAMVEQVLSRLQLRGDEQLLDLGCGDGRLSLRLALRLPRGAVLGVDASADMIAYAQSKFGAPKQPNLRFEVADARALPYREAFDLVVSFNALHWVPDAASALRGIRSALRGGGHAQLRLVTKGERSSLEEVAEEVRRDAAWAPHFAGFNDPYLRLTADAYAACAEACGLRVQAATSALEQWNFGSEAAFFGFCNAGFGAWTRVLPEAQRAVFVRAVMRRYLGPDAAAGNFVFRFVQTDLTLAGDGSRGRQRRAPDLRQPWPPRPEDVGRARGDRSHW